MLPDEFIARLSGVQQHGDYWLAKCPAHNDKKNSLSITTGEDGRLLLKCHAGCDTATIVSTLGLDMKDLFPLNGNGNSGGKGEIVKEYDYKDESGVLRYQVCRLHPKSFRQRRPDGHGGWLWNLTGVSPLLYRLPELLKAVQAGETVFVVEGEKDVESLEKIGLRATCNSGGAGKFPSGMVKHFTGANVAILPDKDPPGANHAFQVAGMLSGTASEIRIVPLPGLLLKGDITNYINGGGTRDQLLALVADAPIWKLEKATSPAVETDFNFTDTGNAKRLIQLFGDVIRYNKSPFGKWFIWSGNRWQEDATDRIYEYADLTVRDMYRLASETADGPQRKEIAAWAKSSDSAQRKKNLVFLAEKEQRIVIGRERLDADPFLFNCQNMTLDLSSGQAVPREHRQADCLTKLSQGVYVPGATCPRWDSFLGDIFAENEEVLVFIRRAVGYSLTGDVSEQCLFFCYGKGANGKSVFLETMRMLFGDFSCKAPAEMLMQQRDNGIPSDVARMEGRRLVIASEIEENRRLNESRVKDLTGGDTVIARRMYQDYTEFQPTHKIWIFGNHKPVIKGDDAGIWRRIRLIPFTVTIPEEHRQPMRELMDGFRAELSGILNWALRGYAEYREKGLGEPEAVRVATREYRDDSDIIGQFIEERCELDGQVQGKALYEGYTAWCTEGNERAIPRKSFIHKIKDRGFCTKEGHGRSIIVTGLSLAHNS